MGNKQKRANTRFAPTNNKLLAALFAEAKKLGIEQDTLRNDIAPAVIGKRLSKANASEIVKVLDRITGQPRPTKYKYESSKNGLVKEIESLAKARWGDGYEKPLNSLVNTKRGGIKTHYKFLAVASLKALKQVIFRLNEEGPYEK